MSAHTCPSCGRPLTCHHCISARGGTSTSAAKTAAAKANGKRGGRPKKTRKGA